METIKKPEFVSEVCVKDRPELKVLSVGGKGDPREAFDKKIDALLCRLSKMGVKPTGPAIGVFYSSRKRVGVENVIWDACAPVNDRFQVDGEFQFQIFPPARVASVTLTESYDLIEPALDYLEGFLLARGMSFSWPLTEIYLREGEQPITELQYLVLRDCY